jgi:hypothetical protein
MRQILSVTSLAIVLAWSIACTSTETPLTPVAPTTPSTSTSGGATLKASAPTPTAPVGDKKLPAGDTEVVLTATPASTLFANGVPLQYQFQVLDNNGKEVFDSGLVSTPSVKVDVGELPINTRHTWRTRAEFQGNFGPWSSAASFITADIPPDPIGPWQKVCSGLNELALVTCIWNFVTPGDQFDGFEVTKRVAWALRKEGAGLLIKNGGENVVPWQGHNFSASRICFPDGFIIKVLGDVGEGGNNSPAWVDNGYIDPSLYVPAIDPVKP